MLLGECQIFSVFAKVVLLLPGKQVEQINTSGGKALLKMYADYVTAVLIEIIISLEHLYRPEVKGYRHLHRKRDRLL